MIDTDINSIIDFAISEEIRFQKIYSNASENTDNNSLKKLLNELAAMEKTHEEKLKTFKSGKIGDIGKTQVEDLKISDYMSDSDLDENSGIQDILVYSMKSEKKAGDMYTKLSEIVNTEEQKKLFLSLANEELGHKNRLEEIYEEHFMKEN